MNMKKLNKIALILLSLMLIFSIFTNYVNAKTEEASYASQMSTLLGEGTGGIADNPTDASRGISNTIGSIMTIARIAGMTIAIVMLLACAMKYMTAAPGEKADVKKSITAYVVGAVVLFGVTGILGIIASFAKVFEKTA